MRSDTTVLVDVVIPVRAPAPWLREALESVVAQSFAGWRLVVVMDGYSSEVVEVCESLGPDVPLLLAELPARSGLVAALNHGLSLCSAEFVARLDADDVAAPARFETQLAYLQDNSECVVLGTGVDVIDGQGRALGGRSPSVSGSVMRQLRWRCPVAHPSVMMRRDAVEAVGGYRAQARHAEDFDLWLRMGAIGDVCAIADPLTKYRIHDGQVTTQLRFPPSTVAALKESRIRLAQARGNAVSTSKLRHAVWLTANTVKGR